MNTSPDSALSRLMQIENPASLYGKQRADYALLYTQLLDKVYRDSLQSDSLIKIAVDYYRSKERERVKRGKAYFYYGKVLAQRKRFSDAMQAYLEASASLDGTSEYKMQGMVSEYIGYLKFAQSMYDSSIVDFKKSLKYYKLANEKKGMLYSYRNIARSYFPICKYDSVAYYVHEGLSECDTVGPIKSSFFQLLGMIAAEKKEFSMARDYYMSAIEVCNNVKEKYRYSLSLGYLYQKMGEDEQAIACFNYSCQSSNPFIASGAYYSLATDSKRKGHFEQAYTYKERADSLLEIVHNNELQKQLLDLQNKYENDKLVLENAQVRLEKKIQTYSYLFFLLLILVVSMIVVLYIRNKYRRRFQRNIELIRKNNRLIEHSACRIAELENIGKLEQEANKEQIGKLNQKILCLVAENQRLRENSSVDALFVLEEMKQGRLIVERMTNTERQHVFDFLNLIYADYVTRLGNEFRLTKNELLLATLLKVGFSNKQLMIVFDCEIKSVYKSRQRLKQSLGLGKDDSLEAMLSAY